MSAVPANACLPQLHAPCAGRCSVRTARFTDLTDAGAQLERVRPGGEGEAGRAGAWHLPASRALQSNHARPKRAPTCTVARLTCADPGPGDPARGRRQPGARALGRRGMAGTAGGEVKAGWGAQGMGRARPVWLRPTLCHPLPFLCCAQPPAASTSGSTCSASTCSALQSNVAGLRTSIRTLQSAAGGLCVQETGG